MRQPCNNFLKFTFVTSKLTVLENGFLINREVLSTKIAGSHTYWTNRMKDYGCQGTNQRCELLIRSSNFGHQHLKVVTNITPSPTVLNSNVLQQNFRTFEYFIIEFYHRLMHRLCSHKRYQYYCFSRTICGERFRGEIQ